ncbi:NADH-ubiquinone oxidoreductase-F iron-sulfur binding region domain-containing protein [Aeromicrobium sp.]|uniref:NADH-ubiquinone oxidoreductase-F iron-sulfur binding region domain-containing protein n=1 Tax=Aeromicrobium sp. TaxID=1871063 RepID=UPI00198E83C2|nr:NADH-ubiquinone oxidoreductase-F iron-sulfur binding region domain-containing protein [Aeromicrobium sp.]MBC7633566.1 oxidoreductase [Aeromicrobium sp.]
MTLIREAAAPATTTVSVLGTPRLLAGVVEGGRVDLAHHRALHGDLVLRRRTWLSGALHDVNLLGRGGAAFPVAAKLDAMPLGRVNIVVNGSEGEPASRKDRVLMTCAPHLVIDGAVVAAHALGARDVTIVIHDAAAHESVRLAALERSDVAGMRIVRTHDGFVGGEIRSVINGLNGAAAIPGGRRTLPHVRGVGGAPSFASNVETFAHLALVALLGVDGYARTGSTAEPGTSLLTLIGDVATPGVVEVPNGVPLGMLFAGQPDAPVLIGGYHGTWVRGVAGLVVERASLRAAGSPLGAGVIARPYAGTCVLDEVVRVSRWLASESSGQCGPCFFGLPALSDDMAALAVGAGTDRLASLTRRVNLVRGRGACAHPDGSVQFISSAVRTLGDELETHARHGSCGRPASTVLPLPAGGS